MAIERITKFSDAIQPADIINEVVDVVNNADLEEFVGASESQAGKKGIVPAPEAGSPDRYLNADGTWKEVKQNLTIYTSLEQIGITPGEETFESIHNALPLNSELVYYRGTSLTFNSDMYPEGSNFGYVKITKLNNGLTKFEYIQYLTTSNDEGSIEPDDQLNIGIVWETYFNGTYPLRPVIWNRHITSAAKDVQKIIGSLSIDSPTTNSVEKIRLITPDLNGSDETINKYSDIVFRKDDSFRLGGIRVKMNKVDPGDGSDELRSSVAIFVNRSEEEGNGAYEAINCSWSNYLQKVQTTINGDIKLTGNLTSTRTITGTQVVGAVYNDYAEFFPRGEETEAGDIIMLDPNSIEEKYIKASTSISTEYPLIVGIHSEEYSHIIGGDLPKNENEDYYEYNIKKYIPVGLMGRCHVKLKGRAIKGAPVTISDIPGVGICTNDIYDKRIIGYLVESDNIEDENTIRLLKVKLK